jgi:hypothetical protein
MIKGEDLLQKAGENAEKRGVTFLKPNRLHSFMSQTGFEYATFLE